MILSSRYIKITTTLFAATTISALTVSCTAVVDTVNQLGLKNRINSTLEKNKISVQLDYCKVRGREKFCVFPASHSDIQKLIHTFNLEFTEVTPEADHILKALEANREVRNWPSQGIASSDLANDRRIRRIKNKKTCWLELKANLSKDIKIYTSHIRKGPKGNENYRLLELLYSHSSRKACLNMR